MSYEITFQRHANFVQATVVGTNSAETVAAYLRDVVNECEKQDCFFVLIHEQLEGPRLEMEDVYAVASKGAAESLGVFQAIAYVDEKMGDMQNFAETVARNRGIPGKVFSTVSEAKYWLRRQVEGGAG